MAGEWIKVRTNLWNDPRLSQLCDKTGVMEATVIGGLYWLWATADEHTETGVLVGQSLAGVDRKTGIPGFGNALVDIGWVVNHPEGIELVRFDEHNGASAKQRAQTAKRVANHKNGTKVTQESENGNAASVSCALPREEKNRDKEEQEQNKGQKQPQQQPHFDAVPASTPKKRTRPEKPQVESETGKVWAAYANAYWEKYKVPPVRNAKVNAQLSQLVKRLGTEEAEYVATFYLLHRARFYVEKMHPVGLLLADCEKLRTEWATSMQMTSTRATQEDRTQTNFDAFAPLLAEAEARERENASK